WPTTSRPTSNWPFPTSAIIPPKTPRPGKPDRQSRFCAAQGPFAPLSVDPSPRRDSPMHTSTTPPEPDRDWPLLWFSRLEAAIERGDYQGAAHAQRELERLGVTVQYRGRWPVRLREARHDW